MRLKLPTLFLLLSAEGCALFGPSPPAQPEIVLTGYGPLSARVHQASWNAASMSALCDVAFQRGGQEEEAEAVLLAARPDSLYLELSGPMGIALGALAISQGRLTINNLHEGWRWEGEADAGHFARFALPMSSPERLVEALTGGPLPPQQPHESIEWHYDQDTARYHIEEASAGRTRRWEIDPFNFTVLRLVTVKENLLATVEYSEYHPQGLQMVPTGILLEASGASLAFDCPALNLDVPLEESDFALPPVPGLRLSDGVTPVPAD